MKKGNFMRYLGYALFAVAAFILVGMFFSTAKMGRTGNYFKDEVFPHFKNYDQNDDYLNEYVTVSNGFYDKDPIYTYKQDNAEASDIQFSLNIYRGRFTRVTNSLYFFPKESSSNGFIIEFKDLKYKGEDIMDLNRLFDSKEAPVHLFRVYLRFSPAVLPHVKQSDSTGAYAYTMNPLYPAIIDESLLRIDKDQLAELVEIRLVHVPYDADKKPNEDEKETLFVLNSDGQKIHGDKPIYLADLNLVNTNYTFTTAEVAGKLPTEAEITANNLSYKKLELSQYNGSVTVTTLIVVLVVILAAYFMFGHKLVIAKIQEKRTAKRMAAKKATSLAPKESIEADFTEVAEDTTPSEEDNN